MNVEEVVQYWVESAEGDWPVANHLFDSGDYHYALFFGHLYLEKLLKALVVQQTEEHAPRTHNLLLLATVASLELSEETSDVLERVTPYNLEPRYPEELKLLRKMYTKDFTRAELQHIEEVGKWLKLQLKQRKAS